MSSTQEIGGIPLGILCIKSLLPTNKVKRRKVMMVITLLLTYIIYLSFQTARRPIIVVQMKIIRECNVSLMYGEHLSEEDEVPWCKGTVFEKHAKEIMVRLAGYYVGSYAICMFFSGCIVDYFNPRYYLSTGCLFAAFFSITLGLANLWHISSVEYFTMAVIMCGAAQSTAWPVLLSCATHWYSGKRIGLFFGVWNTHTYVGSVLGIHIAVIYVQKTWGWCFIVPGLMLAVVTIFVFLFLVVHPTELKNLDAPRKSIFATDDTEVVPPWLSSWRSLDFYEAFKVPGVIEFSACLFFSRIVSYTFLFCFPSLMPSFDSIRINHLANVNTPFVVGGIVGGLLTGILKDLYKRSALISICFLLLSIPAIALQMVTQIQNDVYVNAVLHFILGILVEGPYVLINTSVSVDLGSHGIIRRGHRGLATVAAIVEGSGALGATIAPFASIHFMHNKQWNNIFFLMMSVEGLAALCLARMAVKDYLKRGETVSLYTYWAQ